MRGTVRRWDGRCGGKAGWEARREAHRSGPYVMHSESGLRGLRVGGGCGGWVSLKSSPAQRSRALNHPHREAARGKGATCGVCEAVGAGHNGLGELAFGDCVEAVIKLLCKLNPAPDPAPDRTGQLGEQRMKPRAATVLLFDDYERRGIVCERPRCPSYHWRLVSLAWLIPGGADPLRRIVAVHSRFPALVVYVPNMHHARKPAIALLAA